MQQPTTPNPTHQPKGHLSVEERTRHHWFLEGFRWQAIRNELLLGMPLLLLLLSLVWFSHVCLGDWTQLAREGWRESSIEISIGLGIALFTLIFRNKPRTWCTDEAIYPGKFIFTGKPKDAIPWEKVALIDMEGKIIWDTWNTAHHFSATRGEMDEILRRYWPIWKARRDQVWRHGKPIPIKTKNFTISGNSNITETVYLDYQPRYLGETNLNEIDQVQCNNQNTLELSRIGVLQTTLRTTEIGELPLLWRSIVESWQERGWQPKIQPKPLGRVANWAPVTLSLLILSASAYFTYEMYDRWVEPFEFAERHYPQTEAQVLDIYPSGETSPEIEDAYILGANLRPHIRIRLTTEKGAPGETVAVLPPGSPVVEGDSIRVFYIADNPETALVVGVSRWLRSQVFAAGFCGVALGFWISLTIWIARALARSEGRLPGWPRHLIYPSWAPRSR